MTGNKTFLNSVSIEFLSIVLSMTVYNANVMDSSELKKNALYCIRDWGMKWKSIKEEPSVFYITWNKVKKMNKEIPERLLDPMSLAKEMEKTSGNKKSLVIKAKKMIMKVYEDRKQWLKSKEETQKLEVKLEELHKSLFEQMLTNNKEKDLDLVLKILKELPILIAKIRKDDLQAKVKLTDIYKIVENSIKKPIASDSFLKKDKISSQTLLTPSSNTRRINDTFLQKVMKPGLVLREDLKANKNNQLAELDTGTKFIGEPNISVNPRLITSVSSKELDTCMGGDRLQKTDREIYEKINRPFLFDESELKQYAIENVLQEKNNSLDKLTKSDISSGCTITSSSELKSPYQASTFDTPIIASDKVLIGIEELEKILIELNEERTNLKETKDQLSNVNAQLIYQYNTLFGLFQEEVIKSQNLINNMGETLNGKKEDLNRVNGLEKQVYWNKQQYEQLNWIASDLQGTIGAYNEQNLQLQTELDELSKKQIKFKVMTDKKKAGLVEKEKGSVMSERSPKTSSSEEGNQGTGFTSKVLSEKAKGSHTVSCNSPLKRQFKPNPLQKIIVPQEDD